MPDQLPAQQVSVGAKHAAENPPHPETKIITVLQAIVHAALDETAGSINNLLSTISDVFNGFGCALWQTTPATDIHDPANGELFVLAEHFKDGARFAMHDLPLLNTWTGEVVIKNAASNIPDVTVDRLRSKNFDFVKKYHIGPMISVPIVSQQFRGAINVYRQLDQPRFSSDELHLLGEVAQVVCPLFTSSRERAGFLLLRRVDEIIRRAETEPLMSLETKRGYLKRICDEVAKFFNALETSVFLSDQLESPQEYALQATTWEDGVEQASYQPDEKAGRVTAWILAKKQSVNVFNLPDYQTNSKRRGKEYPGMHWSRSEYFLNAIGALLGNDDKNFPPFSFMGVPILVGEKILGVLRCCTAKSSPFFFSKADLKLMELIAAQVGLCWSSWLTRTEMRREGEAWQSVVGETSKLNRLAQTKVGSPEGEKELFESGLQALASRIPGDNILSIRLFDSKTKELYFECVHGDFWKQGTPEEQAARTAHRFPITRIRKIYDSVGEQVFRRRRVFECRNFTSDGMFKYAKWYPGAKGVICAPISVDSQVYGVIDIIFPNERNHRGYAKSFVELLGQQLGLYLRLLRTINELRGANQDSQKHSNALQALLGQQQRAFEDLSHQLKGPLRLARARAERLRKGVPFTNSGDAQALLGQLRKTQRVAGSVRLLAELEGDRTPLIMVAPVDPPNLVPLLCEIAEDTFQIVRSRLFIRVRQEEFVKHQGTLLSIDQNLLEQAISCLYDNAAKYSFPDTRIEVYCGRTGNGRFYIAVANVGLRLRGEAVHLCKKRTWRSDEAMSVTGEGSGIGLWIVDHIMKAHNGELVIEPTSDEDVTIVKLIFPTN